MSLDGRQTIYERARKAQLAQLQAQRPPLLESDIAREREALDQAIAFVEAKLGGTPSETVVLRENSGSGHATGQ
jgi:hypothetical protein